MHMKYSGNWIVYTENLAEYVTLRGLIVWQQKETELQRI